MKAGIDFGSSVVKAAWLKPDGSYGMLSTADLDGDSSGADDDLSPEDRLATLLRFEGVTRARATGIGARRAEGIALAETRGDPIADEISLQAEGVRRLLAASGAAPDPFLLVSVGTGTSYTAVRGGAIARFPLGSAIGGGFIAGLAKVSLFMEDIAIGEIGAAASRGTPRDILVKDMVPATAGTMQGEFVVSHFGGFARDDAEVASFDAADRLAADIAASIVRCVAVNVIRDVMLIGMIDGFGPVEDVIFIGTPVARIPRLREDIGRYAAALGKRASFPAHGEYAAAIGALHAE